MAFVENILRLNGKPAYQLCIKPHGCVIGGARGFFSLPSFPRATSTSPQEVGKVEVDDLTAKDRYRKRGDLLIYNETKRLPYTKKQLYSVIADVEAYPQFVPYCLGSNLVSHKALQGIGTLNLVNREAKPWMHGGYAGETHLLEQELVVGFKAFEERYTSQVECRKWEMVKATAGDSPLFKCLTSTWTFVSPEEISSKKLPTRDDESSSTYVSLQLAFAFASPLHAAVGEYFWKSVSEKMVLAFEKRVKEVYGNSTQEARESQLRQLTSPQMGRSFDESVIGVQQ
ncbi:dehydrase and lipid transport-domain-containing protein [Melampsora americana]|nr:dehydrase and lipid transport-domain-containing protein [Melampsora americana]